MEKGKNCYNCKFRGSVVGSAHSRCRAITENSSNKEKAMELEILLATGKYEMSLSDNVTGESRPIVKLNEHGVKNGWAVWPINFDPIWVEDCAFFKEKE
jgi:hypothetical protein